MLSTPSDLRMPPARDTGSLLAQLLDFPEEDDAHAQPLSAEQLAQQLAFFSEAEFNFETAPPAAATGSTYLQRAGLVTATATATAAGRPDAKPAPVTEPPLPNSALFSHAAPHVSLQSHQHIGSTIPSIQSPATHQVVWGPNGSAFLVQPSPVPGQPSVMVPLQLAASSLPNPRPLLFSSAPSSLSSSTTSTIRSLDPLVPSISTVVTPPASALLPATLVTAPSVLSGSSAATKSPATSGTAMTTTIVASTLAQPSLNVSARSKRSTSTRNASSQQHAASTPSTDVQQVASDPAASHLDKDDDDEDSESPSSKRPKTSMDEDKRRRNTEASARFRLRKKAKEQALERTASELAARLDQLERRTKELETENAWLRGILVDRDGHDRAATAARYAALAAAAGIQPPHSSAMSAIPTIPSGFTAASLGLGTPAAGLTAFLSPLNHSASLSVVGNSTSQS